MKASPLKRLRYIHCTPLLFMCGIFTVSVFRNAKIGVPGTMLHHITPRASPILKYTARSTTQMSTTRHPLIPPYPYNYKFILNEPDKCKREAPFLVIMIIVDSKDVAARHAIRSTWGNESSIPGVSIAKIFLTGISPTMTNEIQNMLQEESVTFKDIIQQDFLDTYNNLTLKTMMGMEWVTKYCSRASYVLKIDSDMFLNVDFLVHKLLRPELPVRTNYMSGYIVSNTGPLRSKAYKWYVPEEVYPKDKYPPYCAGPGYVFSGDLAMKIYDVAQTIQLINMEDSFIGICMDELKIDLTKPPSNVFNGHKIEYNRCQFSSLITVHHYSPQRLLEIWPDFQSRNDSECIAKKTR
ncbi:beta-1,3-galactosyltransferase 2-like [Lissotriton helveticus]